MVDLRRLLAPSSIAVIGGGAWCANVIRECQKIGYVGPVWPVHPTRAEICGVRAFRSVKDLPGVPDAAFVGVNRTATVEVVAALSEMAAGGAVCFASGFAEAEAELSGSTALQTALLDAAGEMPILGPNCYGVLNLVDGAALWPDQHGGTPVETGVAIIAQSSNVAINLTMQRRGLPVSYVVTVGNQAQIDMAEIGEALLADARVTVLGLYLEGIRDLRAFEAMAEKARALGKRIVALKVGASEQAQAAAVSHTASLAGSAAGASALFSRLGIGEVHSLSTFLEVLKVLHVVGPLASNRIASMSCSGGEASLMADSGLRTGLIFPPLNDDQKNALDEVLGPKVALANPLDYHTYIWPDREKMAGCFSAMMRGDLALGIVVLDFPRSDRCDASDWLTVIEAVGDAMQASKKPIAIVASLCDTMPEELAEKMIARGILPLSGVPEALEALDVAASLGDYVAPLPVLLPRPSAEGLTLSEGAAKTALSKFGLAVPRSQQTSNPGAAASKIGFPVVLKGEGVAHKTEAGAVVLGLTDAAEVARAAEAMGCESYLVEEMVEGGLAELLVGVTLDPAHGFLLTLGAGGVLTEVMEDVVSMLLPVTAEEIEAALGRLRMAPVLAGYRGAAGADISSIAAAVLAVQDYVTACASEVLEVEVNPLICTKDRAVAADALIRVRTAQ